MYYLWQFVAAAAAITPEYVWLAVRLAVVASGWSVGDIRPFQSGRRVDPLPTKESKEFNEDPPSSLWGDHLQW